ncbi:P97 family adhesin [Mesomycoplasma ovipneumoniae]|uniref:P97 family adhesin n=1 Tax=Mesomycoplasma ovipneumoniae TaxID=29562 RepID=UPI00083E91C1|nr:hypothetical protein [Mesomycoplasma ovipneumoniae]
MPEKNKNSLILALTAVGGVAIFATTVGLVTRIRYTGENPRAELENLVSRIQNVAFKSDVFDDSTTYSQIKAQLFDNSGKLLAGTDLNKFISFYTQVNSQLRKFEPTFAPNKPFLEFIDLIPNDNDQSFELRFRAKHQIDNNRTAFSTIISKKVSFAQRSQFALAEFNSNLEKITKSFKENIQNLRRTDFSSSFSSPNLTNQKIASLTRVEDFAADVNRAGTQLEAVEKIAQYFPDFQKIINELNFDQNNSFPFKQGTIYNFSLEKHPGTNNFISVDSNSVPSFLVKAELTDDAKFELKNFNIEDAQLLEKIDLVPQVSSNSSSSQDANNEGNTAESGEKQTKQATYFADLDDILSKISIRKLNFLDFKIAPGQITQTPASVTVNSSSPSTSESSPQLQQVNSVQLFQDQEQQAEQQQNGEQAQGQNGNQTEGQGTGGGQTQTESPEQTPSPETKPQGLEEFVNKLTVNSFTSLDFLETLNRDLYKSNQTRSESVVKAINDNLLIKPISLDFGELSPYFSQRKVSGVDFYLDINRAKATSNTLEIPVNINLYSSFFGDNNPKLLKSKREIFEIKYFKQNTATTGTTHQLDKNRQEFYFINSLPDNSPQLQQVAVSTTAQPTIHEEKIVTTTSFISKTELEKLIEDNNQKSEELKQILSNKFQYGYDFNPHEAMLKSWTGNQKFPKLSDFLDFQSDDQTGSHYGIKSLKSDKFFTNEHDVAAFYAYLLSMEPTEILEYLFEIAKSANLIDLNEQINITDIKEGNIFKTAYDIKFKPESNIMGLDFNGHVKTFDRRGWISNLFLPKTIADQFKNDHDDDKIFEKLNKISPATIRQSSSASTGQTTTDDIYKDIREKTKKINESTNSSGSNTGILNLVSAVTEQNQELTKSVEELVKNFYSTKTEKLTNLKDLLLAFYVKAKELNNFRAWAKVDPDLDYQIVFEKQTGPTANYSSTGIDIPSGSEGYELTYYYKIFNKQTKTEEYQSPKTALKILVSTNDQKQSEEIKTLNKAVLSIPPSYSLLQYQTAEFEKIAATPQTGDQTSQKAFEATKEFKEIQEIIKKYDPTLALSVKSETKDVFHPDTIKIVLLEVTKNAQSGSEATENPSQTSEKSQLNFQIRIQKLPESPKPADSGAADSSGSEPSSTTTESSTTPTTETSSATETTTTTS